MNSFALYLTLFLTGGSIYSVLELLYDGTTHYSMFILGGLTLIIVGLLNEITNLSVFIQMLIGGFVITFLELVTGTIFNANYTLWDYRDLPFNYRGQICLLFSLLWVGLSYVAIVIDDTIRGKLK